MAFVALTFYLGRRVPFRLPGQARQFSSAATCATSAWTNAANCTAPTGSVLPALAEQLINLRRQFSAPTAYNGAYLATPAEVGITPPPSASAEASRGLSSGPSSGSAETSTGLGNPESIPSGESKFGEGSIEKPPAERTIDPAGDHPPTGDRPSDVETAPRAEPGSGKIHSPEETKGDTSGRGSSSGMGDGPLPDPDRSSKDDDPAIALQPNQQTFIDDLTDVFRYHQSRMWMKSIVFACDPSFNESDFLESAKDAYWMVLDLFSNENFDKELLSQMLSEAMISNMRTVHQEYLSQGLAARIIENTVDSAAIVNMEIMDKAMMANLDAERAAEGPDLDDSSTQSLQYALNPYRAAWLVISVKFTGMLKTEMFDVNSRKAMKITEDRRSHIWRFARGPLPNKLPEQNLEAPWIVLDLVE